jgi:hypothetical protein
LAQLKVKFHSKSELLALLQSMVYKTKAQQQVELAELAEVLFISVLQTGDDSDHGLDTDCEDDEEWQSLNDQADDVLETIAMRTLGFVESMSESGSQGSYDGIAHSKDYFSTLLQQPDERFCYVFR